jgi:DtxR family Mn-dependent transcriptional regulator
MPLDRTTPAVQDYLKALCLHELESDDASCPTSTLAGRLAVSAASATNMLKKLDAMGLVEHVPYKGAALTDPGRKIALEVVRHHRLLETYLAEALGVPWDRIHDEAEVLEHVLSEDLEDRIARLLGDPAVDPHGHPIPAKDGSMPFPLLRRLWDVSDGMSTRVDRVPDDDPEVLRYLQDIGMRPRAALRVVGRGPGTGPLFVEIEGDENAISRPLAEAIWVD